MEKNDIQPDPIACSSLMEAFNKGCQPSRVLQLAELMKEKNIPLNTSALFGIISACSILGDWKSASEMVNYMEPSSSLVSVGHLNHLLHFLGRSGKIETMMKLFCKILASGVKVSSATYCILLKNLLAAGKWQKYIEVLHWMEDAGIQPSARMYWNVFPHAWKNTDREYTVLIQEKIKKLKDKVG
ncbi:hypothetical protein J5N97_009207 [Dioscorea zingiberensis]|uniref:Pentatricopeptide repeat-containing protein n=1 Tax=Dioscorea zingiberensis TaxID=325984 RepID=A0A9D5CYB5_9LILI|nr:hypothetical protein J5N97_009207 [Dioscorea zingiberensis]